MYYRKNLPHKQNVKTIKENLYDEDNFLVFRSKKKQNSPNESDECTSFIKNYRKKPRFNRITKIIPDKDEMTEIHLKSDTRNFHFDFDCKVKQKYKQNNYFISKKIEKTLLSKMLNRVLIKNCPNDCDCKCESHRQSEELKERLIENKQYFKDKNTIKRMKSKKRKDIDLLK